MTNKHLAIVVCASLGGLLACTSTSRDSAGSIKPKDVVATVNGKPIGRGAISKQPHGAGTRSEEQQIDELVSRELLRQEAEKNNLAADPAVAESYDNAVRIALSQVAAEHYMKTASITDQEAKQAYDAKVGSMAGTEYKARHILVDSETSAKEVIAKLNKGGNFEALAKQYSKDPGSKGNGGDLGWFAAAQMVEPFSRAVAALKNGETTATPVQTQFGWHVIRRDESRAQQAPRFEEVKPQVVQMLQAKKLQAHVEELKKTAKVDVHKPAGAPERADKPAVPTAAAAPPTP